MAIEKQKSVSELALEQKKVDAELQLERERFEANQKLERQKLDADLVKLALQASGIDKGGETLGFMVAIREGVSEYLNKQKPVPVLQNPAPVFLQNQENALQPPAPIRH